MTTRYYNDDDYQRVWPLHSIKKVMSQAADAAAPQWEGVALEEKAFAVEAFQEMEDLWTQEEDWVQR